jgi:RNA polymerase sigma-70 factor (ECF subfamily)
MRCVPGEYEECRAAELPCWESRVRLVPCDMIGASHLLPDAMTLIEALIAESVRALADAAYAQPRDMVPDTSVGDLDDIERTRAGDPDAYRRLVERYQGYVAGILWRFSRERRDHEELVQDVFVEAYLGLASYRGKAPFQHWLARIATRVGYRYWKEKARRRKAEPFNLEQWDRATEDDGIASALEPDHAAALLYHLLEQLPPRDRLVLTLRYLDQCDVAEAAQRTGWTKTMVKVQTLRAKKRLQNLVERSGMELA